MPQCTHVLTSMRRAKMRQPSLMSQADPTEPGGHGLFEWKEERNPTRLKLNIWRNLAPSPVAKLFDNRRRYHSRRCWRSHLERV